MLLLCLLLATDVAITVDDLPAHGPAYPGIDRAALSQTLLAAFKRHGVPVTGFVNGSKLQAHPELQQVLNDWSAAGAPLGNHGFGHLSLTATAPAEYLADIERNEPFANVKIFRYPFLFEGETPEKHAAVRAWLAAHGYRVAQVTIDGDDWAWNPPFARCTAQGDLATLGRLRRSFLDAQVQYLQHYRALGQQLEGRDLKHIYLMHLGAMDADQIEPLLSSFEAAGMRFIPLDEALQDPIYAADHGVATKAGSTLLDKLSMARKTKPPPFQWPDEKWLEKACR